MGGAGDPWLAWRGGGGVRSGVLGCVLPSGVGGWLYVCEDEKKEAVMRYPEFISFSFFF
jgi:hypothetical protein